MASEFVTSNKSQQNTNDSEPTSSSSSNNTVADLTRFDPETGQLLPDVQTSKPHPLGSKFSFWFVRRAQGSRTQENYEKNIRRLATVDTVEGFWCVYNHLTRPNDLSVNNDYHVFREGIKPTWEDENNKKGGKWIVRLRKGLASRYWEDLLLAVIGEQIPVGNELCGIGVSLRYNEDILSIWNRNADDTEAKKVIYEAMSKALPIQSSSYTSVEYKAHDTALQLALKRQKHKAAQQKNRADEDAAAVVDNEKKTEN